MHELTESHALVLGGTGMLRELVLQQARLGGSVTVQGRDPARARRLEEEGGGRVHALIADWEDTGALVRAVGEALTLRGPVVWSVAWMHSSQRESTLAVAAFLARECPRARYFDVQGSARRPADLSSREAGLRAAFGHRYRRVILGHRKLPGGRRRWLHDGEIWSGVWEAIDSNRRETVVGEID